MGSRYHPSICFAIIGFEHTMKHAIACMRSNFYIQICPCQIGNAKNISFLKFNWLIGKVMFFLVFQRKGKIMSAKICLKFLYFDLNKYSLVLGLIFVQNTKICLHCSHFYVFQNQNKLRIIVYWQSFDQTPKSISQQFLILGNQIFKFHLFYYRISIKAHNIFKTSLILGLTDNNSSINLNFLHFLVLKSSLRESLSWHKHTDPIKFQINL